MAELRNHSEPSMEEILASIRRIIVEDNGPQSLAPSGRKDPSSAAAGAAPAPAGAPTAAAPGQSRVAGSEPQIRTFSAPPPQSGPSPPVQEAILDLTERIDDEAPVHRAAAAMSHQPPPMNSARLNRPPPLKSNAIENVEPRPAPDVAASIATLAKIAGIGQAGRQPELPLGDVGRTLEDMVRELLRQPMKEWLDANLPRLVERMVRDEINRLVRDAQDR
jgi:cell pole-organizing protein PopZ